MLDTKTYRIILVGGVVIASEVIWQLYKRFYCRWKRDSKVRETPETKISESGLNISEVMFFRKPGALCRAHSNKNYRKACLNSCCPAKYLRTLQNHIDSANGTIDVCLYMLTCESLSEAIVNAHKRGVLVRVILDIHMAYNDSSQTSTFHKNGIPLRMQPDGELMHHKFIIIDGKILITGSTNWTMSAFFGNYDNILVTNQLSLVMQFELEFEKLWKDFSATTFTDKTCRPMCDSTRKREIIWD